MVTQQLAVQMGLRHRLYQELEPDARVVPGLTRTNGFIVALVIFSFIIFAIETEPTTPPVLRGWIRWSNLLVLAAFAVEYVIRLWVVGENPKYRGLVGRLRYVTSFYAVTDLLAFLPELLWLSLMPAAPGDRTITVLRVLRLLRLLKIARFVPAFEVLGAAVRRAGKQLLTTLVVALALVYVSAVVLYFIEGVREGRAEFASIPRAIWWAVATLTTVGYGDVYPVTTLGRMAASVIALAGIGVVALPAGIFASAFSDELRDRDMARLELQKEVAEAEAASAAATQSPDGADAAMSGRQSAG